MNNVRQRLLRPALLGLVLAGLGSGCSKDAMDGSAATQESTSVVLQLQAGDELNPTVEGYSAPVRVRLLELRSAAAFSRTDYFSLAERAAATLGGELVAEDEWLVHPGQTRELKRTLAPETRHLGLLVGYREIDRAQWRVVLEPKQGTRSHYRIDLGTHAASAAELAAPSRLDSR
ncbi:MULTISPECIES: type VI secretion system lipoprotein TssJ [Pseudomonadaceae]|jgi:type VI secretion system protein VasD|uniref:type VI secretion system lipoprotein TssJ n=1 Tax=Pseudomonadaceae TaxID=135621 RepID=UPI000206E939|nr:MULTISPECIES: type VI secretion system lipoprotein TssJ [Pseudomonas]AEB56048.1 putative lipoprotein [Pseudomonas mendocina NK-01]RRV21848.1 type VI secretion system lipoprotein TssJ [Pseudomonas sp. o96-267]TRO41465.1 type VI secretion system lipoprotein TssJ [Pseudomonas sp. ALS1131]